MYVKKWNYYNSNVYVYVEKNCMRLYAVILMRQDYKNEIHRL